jgi:threonine/homoserine/homoserine lactone efflux protein
MLDLYLAFVLATTVLILIPGPNVTLLLANRLVVVALGMTSLIVELAAQFEWLRRAGVALLIWLGIQQSHDQQGRHGDNQLCPHGLFLPKRHHPSARPLAAKGDAPTARSETAFRPSPPW